MVGVEPPTKRERLNEQVVRSRYVISADDIVGVPRTILPREMTKWFASSEYQQEKMSYPAYCESSGFDIVLGPGVSMVAGKVSSYVRDEK